LIQWATVHPDSVLDQDDVTEDDRYPWQFSVLASAPQKQLGSKSLNL